MLLSRALTGFMLCASLSANAMNIKAPDVAENGAVVPVEVSLDPPLSAEQHLELRVNGHLAAQVRVVEGKLSLLSTRIKMAKSGAVSARVIANGRALDFGSKEVKVTIGASMDGPPTAVTSLKARTQNGNLKILMASQNGFAGTLVLQDAGFRAEILGSALLSNNPYLSVNGNFSDRIAVSSSDAQVFKSAPVTVAIVPTPTNTSTPSDGSQNFKQEIPARQKANELAANYDQRINAARQQCKSDKDSCDTKCATLAFIAVLGQTGDTTGHIKCTNNCTTEQDSCYLKADALAQEKKQAVSKAMNEVPQGPIGSGSGTSSDYSTQPNGNSPRIDTSGSQAGSRTLPPQNDPALTGQWAGQSCAGACGRYVADAKCKAAGDKSMSCLTQNGYMMNDTPQLCAQAKALTGCMDKVETLGEKELTKTGAFLATSFDSVCERNRQKINQILESADLRISAATYDLFFIDIQRELAELYQPCMATSKKAREMYEKGMRFYNEGKQHCAGTHEKHECLQWGTGGGVSRQGDPANWYDNPASNVVWKRELKKAAADPNYSADLGTVRERDAKRNPADIACDKALDDAESQFKKADRNIPKGSIVIRSEAVMWLMTQTMDAIRTKCPKSQEYAGLVGRYQRQYADVARVCEAMASAPPCLPRLPGKEPAKTQQIASSETPKTEKPKVGCDEPSTPNGLDCLAKRCGEQKGTWSGPGKSGGYACRAPGGAWGFFFKNGKVYHWAQ